MLECKLKNRDALIINIGTELTLGVTINTNGAWLASRLTRLGFLVRKIVVVRDDEKDVVEELHKGLEFFGLIITTGGLGPTYDDKTSYFISRALGTKLELNELALELVKKAHQARGEDLNEVRIKQAYLPEKAIPISNSVGTAPGFYLCTERNTLIISLPGPPRELKPMFEMNVEPMLRGYTGLEYVEDYYELKGVTESSIAKVIEEVAKKYPFLYLKSHPKIDDKGESVIQIQISLFTDNPSLGKSIIDSAKNDLVRKLREEDDR